MTCARRLKWKIVLGRSVSASAQNVADVANSLRLEDQQTVLVHLEKLNQQQWWENVLTHHPKVDTKKIVPQDSKLSDLDGETRWDF